MADDFRDTWDDIAHHWDDWGPPLRPCEEDLRITLAALKRWRPHHGDAAIKVFMCGVTPEIASMDWPFPIDLLAMDQVPSMVRIVWPGDVSGLRRAMVGNWVHPGLAAASQDLVIGDGGFGFFDYPDGQRALATALHSALKPSGLFVYRHYAQANEGETVDNVVAAANAGAIGNFHIFKWRIAMALQSKSEDGVVLDEIWRVVTTASLDHRRLPQPGWSRAAMDTIRFYRGKDARLYFPTLDEFRGILNGLFEIVEVHRPQYELGERCPIVIARPTRGD